MRPFVALILEPLFGQPTLPARPDLQAQNPSPIYMPPKQTHSHLLSESMESLMLRENLTQPANLAFSEMVKIVVCCIFSPRRIWLVVSVMLLYTELVPSSWLLTTAVGSKPCIVNVLNFYLTMVASVSSLGWAVCVYLRILGLVSSNLVCVSQVYIYFVRFS